jgi:hypothetical protein
LIYIEYVERDRFMPIEIFRYLGNQSAWTDPDDSLVGSFGRTMRIGPMPSYLAFWKCSGMERMDEWEAYFRSEKGKNDAHELATHRAIHLQKAGCYDEIFEGPKVDRSGLHLIEYFAAGTAEPAALTKHFQDRTKKARGATLNFVLRRIGLLGPAPGALAVWTFADYVALEPFVRSTEQIGAYAPTEVGVYRWFGQEIL